jgi:hypothetical protein
MYMSGDAMRRVAGSSTFVPRGERESHYTPFVWHPEIAHACLIGPPIRASYSCLLFVPPIRAVAICIGNTRHPLGIVVGQGLYALHAVPGS